MHGEGQRFHVLRAGRFRSTCSATSFTDSWATEKVVRLVLNGVVAVPGATYSATSPPGRGNHQAVPE